MNCTKYLGTLAIAAGVPLAAASAAGAAPPPSAAAATTTTTTVGHAGSLASADARVVGELSTEGRAPRWYDPQRFPVRTAGVASGPHQSVDSLSPGPWCVYQCIASGVAYAHGDGVELVLETKVPADMQLIVCRDDDGDFDCEYLATEWTGSPETEFHWVIDPLPAGTYWVTAAATDNTGTSHAFGEFTLS